MSIILLRRILFYVCFVASISLLPTTASVAEEATQSIDTEETVVSDNGDDTEEEEDAVTGDKPVPTCIETKECKKAEVEES